MNAHAMTAYGLWPLVVLNAGLVLLFAAGFFRPRTAGLGGFLDKGRWEAGPGADTGPGTPATHGRTRS